MKKNLYLRRALFSGLITALVIGILLSPLVSLASQKHQSSDQLNPSTVLIVGDSLSAAFGIEQSQGWVTLLSRKINQLNYKMNIVNASISGETTQGGLQRLPELLDKHKPVVVIIELGGNDGLRGLQLAMIKSNLQRMIDVIKSYNPHTSILLAGIRLPPNYGQLYTEQFYQIYPDLAKQNNIQLVPFILEGIATKESLMQSDGIHPTAEAQPAVLTNVWEKLLPMLSGFSARQNN